MTNRVYNIDLKSLRLNLYPTADNIGDVTANIENWIRSSYDTMRMAAINTRNQSHASLVQLGLKDLADANFSPLVIGYFDEEFTITTEFEDTLNMHDVHLLNLKVTVTPVGADNPQAFEILNKLDVSGTFAIEPTYRVTGY